MQVTEVRVRVVQNERAVRGYCSFTLANCFTVRDAKIIEANDGWFVVMPDRRLTDKCSSCQCKNPLTARYCNRCGVELPDNRVLYDDKGRAKLYADVCFPNTQECRNAIESAVFKAYEQEVERMKQPDYRCRYYDGFQSENANTSP